MRSPIFNPIPFIGAGYRLFNWNYLASRMEEGADDCYTPTYLMNSVESSWHLGIAKYVAKTINEKYLPPVLNFTTILTITYVQCMWNYNLTTEYK